MKSQAFIWTLLAIGALALSPLRGQTPGAAPWDRNDARPIFELAAKSTDDDDDSSGSHSSTKKKKKAASDDASDSSTGSKTPAAKKKKKKLSGDDDDAGRSSIGSGKNSNATDDETPARKKKKKPKDDEDESPAPSKPGPSEEKPAKDVPPDAATTGSKHGPDATVEPGAITEFSNQPERIQHLITAALDLTKLNLTYAYGSAEPSNGGMDCSGTIYYLLRSQGFHDVPRDSRGQYVWARKQGQFFAVVSTQADSFEFKDLKPGDLMFWSGTYQVSADIPISHVMMYLGVEKRTGKRIMFGSSDGRSYNGVQRWGVSVFDFKMPKSDPNNPDKRHPVFVGYARIPGLHEAAEPSEPIAAATDKSESPAKETTSADSTEKEPSESTPAPKKKNSGKKSVPKKRHHDSDDN